jgi:hypothetical protein
MASANFLQLCYDLAVQDAFIFDGSMSVCLVSSVPTESDLDSWQVYGDITNEVTGTGYTAGGINQPITSQALNTTGNYLEIEYTDIVNGWTGASITALGAIIYTNDPSPTYKKLCHFIDFGGAQTCVAGNFSITYTGTFRINRAA